LAAGRVVCANLLAIGHAVVGAKLLTLSHTIMWLNAVGANLLAIGHAALRLNAVVANLLAIGHAALRLKAVFANLLSVDSAILLYAIGMNLLTLSHARLRPLSLSRPLSDPLRAHLLALDPLCVLRTLGRGKTLHTVHTLGATAALGAGGLTLH